MEFEAGDIDDLPLYYTTHKMSASPGIYEDLIENGQIAIHYELKTKEGKSRESTDPEDWEGTMHYILDRLWGICEDGALIAADYSQYDYSKMIVGVIPPGSEVKNKTYSPSEIETWEHINEDKHDRADGLAYKVVDLEDVVEFDYDKYQMLLSCQTGIQGNIKHWTVGKIEKNLKYLYKRELGLECEGQRNPYLLTDKQLEVLCSEYLRRFPESSPEVDYLLDSVGGKTKDVDIVGGSNNIRSLSQVSFTKNKGTIKKKIKKLCNFVENDKDSKDASKEIVLNYFGPKKGEEKLSEKFLKNRDVKYIPIEKVFEKMKGTKIVEEMLPK